MSLAFPTPGWLGSWQAPDRRPIYEWAHDTVTLPPAYAQEGRFSVASSRHLIEPLDAICDPTVRESTMAAAIQTGKTLVVELGILWALANAPGPVMWTLQTDDDAKEHWKQRFFALLKACPSVAAMLPQERNDSVTGRVYFGPFFLTCNGANLNNLQRVSVRWKFNSEVWLWKPGLLEHARGRVTAFERAGTSKVVNESQGGLVGDDFDRAWQAGDQRIWGTQCHGCRQFIPLSFFQRCDDEPTKFAGVIWDNEAKDDNGDWIVSRCAETARFRCPKCGHEHENTPRTFALWNAEGRYLPQRKDAPAHLRSFRWEATTSRTLDLLVAQWVEACNQKHRGVMQGIVDFYQKRCAIPWDPKGEDFSKTVELKTAGYLLADIEKDPATKIADERYRTMTIDRQQDHFWFAIRAWRTGGIGSRLLHLGKALTPDELRLIQKTYGVTDPLTFMDAQHNKSGTYDDCARFGWTALHGSGRDDFKHQLPNGSFVSYFWSPVGTAMHNSYAVRYIHWARDPVQDTLHRLYSGQGAPFEVADDVPDYYEVHMRNQVKKLETDKSTGRRKMRWVTRGNGQDHIRDCEAMGVAVAYMLRLLTIERHEKETAKEQESKPTPAS
jgi:hypothetical protein